MTGRGGIAVEGSLVGSKKWKEGSGWPGLSVDVEEGIICICLI